MNVIVIGAGISGCACAHQLVYAGHQVTVVEKGRGVGGRMATRRMEGARIDHGAHPQCFIHDDWYGWLLFRWGRFTRY